MSNRIDASLISKRQLARDNARLSEVAEQAHAEGSRFRTQRDVARKYKQWKCCNIVGRGSRCPYCGGSQ